MEQNIPHKDFEKMNLEELSAVMDTFYTLVMDSYENFTTAHDYGNGEKISMTEIHTLTLIADHPGILSSEVARMWNRTRSAATQNINRLHKRGWVEKRRENGNKKQLHLYVTPQGQALSDLHKKYDTAMLHQTVHNLLRFHSPEELWTTFEVMRTGIRLMEENTRQLHLCDGADQPGF